jgi:mRNA interferase HigB
VRLLGTHLIDEFIKKHADAKSSLRRWQKVIQESDFSNLVELGKTFPSADAVEGKTVFNVGGNKIRTITQVEYGIALVIITHVLTHKEYDQGKWK